VDAIRVLIADDHVITRTGLRALLAAREDFEVVGEAQDGAEAIALAGSLEPDVVLMDIRMPGMNGIEATRAIHRARPHIGILVLTVFEDDTLVFPAIRAGARGYLLKDTEQDELLRAIRTVALGGAIFSRGIAVKVLGYLNSAPPNVPELLFDELTAREREILGLIAQGQTNAEIATVLSLSAKTVSNYISNVLLKLHAADRAKLMLMALDAGLGRRSADSP
jgi:DNA-binding NarL/FixJ family response regulator